MFTRMFSGSFIERTPISMKATRENTRGVASFDLDKNGLLDIIFISGWEGTQDRAEEKNEIYVNNGNFEFTKERVSIVENALAAQGVIDTDFDGDGDVDILTCNKGGKLTILKNEDSNYRFSLVYRNDCEGGNNWLKVKLVSPNGQAGAFGARIYVNDTSGELIGLREAKSSYGYLAQDDQVIHFGTGGHEKVNIKVQFVTGEVGELRNVKTNNTITFD